MQPNGDSTYNYQTLAPVAFGNHNYSNNNPCYQQPNSSSTYGMAATDFHTSEAQHGQHTLSGRYANNSDQYTGFPDGPMTNSFGYRKPEEYWSRERPLTPSSLISSAQYTEPRGAPIASQYGGNGGTHTGSHNIQHYLSSSGVEPSVLDNQLSAQAGDVPRARATANRLLNNESDSEEDGLSEYSGYPQASTEDEWKVERGEFVVAGEGFGSLTEKPGTVREDKGYLEWLDPKTKQWRRACIHHNIKRSLIERAQAKYPDREYSSPVKAGKGPYDEISFHIEYQTWGTEQENWPEILFDFDPPDRSPTVTKPKPMTFDGMIVLNRQNNLVLKWDIPDTLSSNTPACFLEAWKRKFMMSHQDRRARIVRYTIETINNRPHRQALSDKNAEAKNSIKDFGRELTKEEQLEVKKGNQANFLNPSPGEGGEVKKLRSTTILPQAWQSKAGIVLKAASFVGWLTLPRGDIGILYRLQL